MAKKTNSETPLRELKLVRVALFGSAAKGDYGPESDLGILMVVREESSEMRP